MHVGKTLFAHGMEVVPWKTFGRLIERHQGDAGVRTLGCADVCRVMALAQLTWRASLRDIEVCLTATQATLLHMGLQAPPARSPLADALKKTEMACALPPDRAPAAALLVGSRLALFDG